MSLALLLPLLRLWESLACALYLAHVALLQRTARDQAQQPCQMVLDKVCSALHRHAVCIAPLGIVRNAQNPNILDICLVGKQHISHSH